MSQTYTQFSIAIWPFLVLCCVSRKVMLVLNEASKHYRKRANAMSAKLWRKINNAIQVYKKCKSNAVLAHLKGWCKMDKLKLSFIDVALTLYLLSLHILPSKIFSCWHNCLQLSYCTFPLMQHTLDYTQKLFVA